MESILKFIMSLCIMKIAEPQVGSLMQIQQQVFSKLKNITHLSLAHSNEFVNNGLLQVIILNMKQIKKLHLPGCERYSSKNMILFHKVLNICVNY